MSDPLLSIICVTFEDESGIRRTLRSLSAIATAAGDEIEVLVQDGGSAFDVGQLSVDFPFVSLVSSPDEGIYDGMQRGLERSAGARVWFLNGGDENLVTSWSDLRTRLSGSPDLVLCFSYELQVGSVAYTRRARPSSYMRHALPTSHQAIFYPGTLARATGYDQSFSVAGDYAFTARILRAGGRLENVDLSVSRFYDGGYSSSSADQIRFEALRVQKEILASNAVSRMISSMLHRIARAKAARRRLADVPPSGGISAFRADLARYPRFSIVLQPALWAIAVYRLGRSFYALPRPLRLPAGVFYISAYSMVRLATGIEIPRSASIGPGLMIHHFGGVVIHPQAVIGRDFTIRQGVTVGSQHDGGPVPVIGDSVSLGAYAQILGGVKVGNGVTVGAMSVVLIDVPDGTVAYGVPARVRATQ